MDYVANLESAQAGETVPQRPVFPSATEVGVDIRGAVVVLGVVQLVDTKSGLGRKPSDKFSALAPSGLSLGTMILDDQFATTCRRSPLPRPLDRDPVRRYGRGNLRFDADSKRLLRRPQFSHGALPRGLVHGGGRSQNS